LLKEVTKPRNSYESVQFEVGIMQMCDAAPSANNKTTAEELRNIQVELKNK
jgi:hypothetical protein